MNKTGRRAHEGLFIWKGARCTDYGIHVLTQPDITVPAERATFTDVPGRSGSLTTLQGEDVYDDMILPAECIVSDLSRINEIAAYLKGGGTVTFACRPGGYYEARIMNQIPFTKVLRGNPHRRFTVTFAASPSGILLACRTLRLQRREPW